MRITTANNREVTMAQAVDRLARRHPELLQGVLVRLLEELTSSLAGPPVLRPRQLARVLEYAFDVEED